MIAGASDPPTAPYVYHHAKPKCRISKIKADSYTECLGRSSPVSNAKGQHSCGIRAVPFLPITLITTCYLALGRLCIAHAIFSRPHACPEGSARTSYFSYATKPVLPLTLMKSRCLLGIFGKVLQQPCVFAIPSSYFGQGWVKNESGHEGFTCALVFYDVEQAIHLSTMLPAFLSQIAERVTGGPQIHA